MTFENRIPGPRDFAVYVYGLRWHLAVIILIFTVFLAAGFSVSMAYPTFTDNTISGFKDEVGPLKDRSPVGLMLGIFENNAIKCFMSVILGLALGIAPIVFIVANGFVIGIVVGSTYAKTGLLYVLVGIVPHGVIEMPMVLISAAIGLKLGTDILRKILSKKTHVLRDVKEAMLVFIFWIVPLLFVSAFLETFVTGTLLYLMFPR